MKRETYERLILEAYDDRWHLMDARDMLEKNQLRTRNGQYVIEVLSQQIKRLSQQIDHWQKKYPEFGTLVGALPDAADRRQR